MGLSFQEDDWLRDRFESTTRWIAYLSDGSTVYQDDDRPGEEEPSAWLRLKDYIKQTGLKIERTLFQFRSHVINFNGPADGFYFSKGILGGVGIEPQFYYIGGIFKDGKLKCTKYKIPELEIDELEHERNPDEYSRGLIKNI